MDSNTHFRNSKKRVIFQSAKGKFFVKKADGSKTYKPKAAYHVANASSNLVKVTKSHAIPAAIRPAAIGGRKVRKNAGGVRMTEAKAYQMIFNTPMPAKKRRVAKPKHTGATPRHPTGRKIRKNAGIAKGHREGYLQRKMNAESKKRAAPKKKKVALRIFKRSNPFAALPRNATR